MSRLYVANCTRQNALIFYRLDFDREGNREPSDRSRFKMPLQQTIAPQRQAQLGGDFHPNQITDIVDQLARHGLIGAVDAPRQRAVAPYVYNIDQPVPASVMRAVIDRNKAILVEQGRMRREKAAIAVDRVVQQAVESAAMAQGLDELPPLSPVETSFEQDAQSEEGERAIAEGYKLDPKAPDHRQKARRRRQ